MKPLLAAAALALPTLGSAQTVSVPVSFADLSLTTAAGRATLDRRISLAVRSICGRASVDLSELRRRRACTVEALASASPQKSVAIARAERGVQVAQAR